jgi:hypothetical protein
MMAHVQIFSGDAAGALERARGAPAMEDLRKRPWDLRCASRGQDRGDVPVPVEAPLFQFEPFPGILAADDSNKGHRKWDGMFDISTTL